MQIHIYRDGQQHGPYSLEEINKLLENGDLLTADLAWHDGIASWVSLSEMMKDIRPSESISNAATLKERDSLKDKLPPMTSVKMATPAKNAKPKKTLHFDGYTSQKRRTAVKNMIIGGIFVLIGALGVAYGHFRETREVGSMDYGFLCVLVFFLGLRYLIVGAVHYIFD